MIIFLLSQITLSHFKAPNFLGIIFIFFEKVKM